MVSDKIYKNILLCCISALLIFTPMARGTVRTWSLTPALSVIYTLIFIWLCRINNHIHSPQPSVHSIKRTPLDIPIAIFILLAAISFIFSIYKYDSLHAILRLIGYIGVYYLVINEFDRDMIKRALMLVIGIGTSLSIYGLLQYFNILDHSWWVPKEFLASTYVNHNHFAGYLELIIPVTVGTLFIRVKGSASAKASADRQGSRVKGFILIALIIMISAFLLTQSRGAWISLALSFIVMNVVFVKKGIIDKGSVSILLLLVFIILAFIGFGKEMILSRIDLIDKELSSESRLNIWRGCIEMIKNNPFVGTGIGTFITGFSSFRPEGLNMQANFAHNDYLNMACEMGVLAPLTMLWIFVIVITHGLNKRSDPMALGCAIGILSLSLHGLFDFNFHIPANMLLFTLYISFVIKKTCNKQEAC